MPPRLIELALLFLRLGLTAFGGPAAHIAMMQREVVERRKWLSAEAFLDLVAATSFIPGPNSTELAIHIGLRRAGWRGLLVAGACFIVPATLITLAIAWAYQRYHALPEMDALLYGIKPVMVAIVVQAIHNLGRTALRTRPLAALALAAALANVLGAHELLVLACAGLVAALAPERSLALFPAPTSLGVFTVFGKIGSVLFGSGYVLLAFLRVELVERRQWLSEAELLDAVAVGQMTPGPVFSTATFIGYLLLGVRGAAAATAGIFLPAFVFVALSGPLIPRLRRSPRAGRFLDGVNAASLALMAVVTFDLAGAAMVDPWTVALAGASTFLLLRHRLNASWLVLGGAVAGYLVRALV